MVKIFVMAGSDGSIQGVTWVEVVAQRAIGVPVGMDSEKYEAFLVAHKGETVARDEFEAAVAAEVQTVVQVLTATGNVLVLPGDVAALVPVDYDADLLFDFVAHWREGKYLLAGGVLVLNPDFALAVLQVDDLTE